MNVRAATADDAAQVAAIYAPIVRDTFISFEAAAPSAQEMEARITAGVAHLPWLLAEDATGAVAGCVYASRHRERASYRWSVDTTAYVRAGCRGQGLGRRRYDALFDELRALWEGAGASATAAVSPISTPPACTACPAPGPPPRTSAGRRAR